MLDYLQWRGDLSFEADPVNEVDCLIFAEIAYADMDGIAGEGFEKPETVSRVWERYSELGRDQSFLVNDPSHVLKAAAGTKRFGGVPLCGYVNTVDAKREIQFSAVTFLPLPGQAVAAYRGTDNTIVGWREDFNMNFLPETPGQRAAAEYLDSLAAAFKGGLTAAGHSKGGNFAVFAAAFCGEEAKSRVNVVYSFDGPGLNPVSAESPQYSSVLGRVTKIIPDSSVIGRLLSSRETPVVIKSDEKGVQQHNPYSWQVSGGRFVRTGLRQETLGEETILRWSSSLDESQWQCFSKALFDALESSGAETLYELNSSKATYYTAVARALSKTDKTVYKGFVSAAKKLLESGREAVITKVKNEK